MATKPALTPFYEALPELPDAWRLRLRERLGLGLPEQEGLGIRLWTNPATGEERLAIPVHDGNGQLRDIRLVLPFAEEFQAHGFWTDAAGERIRFGRARLWPHPARLPENAIMGSRFGLPGADPRRVLIICRDEVETLAALGLGLPALCVTAAPGSWRAGLDPAVADCHVILAFPDDLASQDAAEALAAKLCRKAASVRIFASFGLSRPEDADQPRTNGPGMAEWAAAGKGLDEWLMFTATAREIKAPPPPEDEVDDPALARFRAKSALDGDKETFRPLLLAREILAQNRIITERISGITYRWDGMVWRAALEAELKRLVISTLGLAVKKNAMADTLELVRALSLLPEGKEMNPHPHPLSLQNGVLDLDTGRIRPHDPGLLSTWLLPWSCDPRTPGDCPRFKRYMAETVQDPGAICDVQEFFGYCLWRGCHWPMALICIGPGSDGKSVLLRVLKDLVGPDNCTSVNLKDFDDQFQRVALHNKALNIFPEASANFFSTDYFKALTAGDTVRVSQKHQPSFDMTYWGKIAFSAQEFPRVLDNSYAFFRRVMPVQFKRQFKDDADPFLSDALRAEMDGIGAWALVGLYRLRRRGRWARRAATREALNSYRYENNPTMGWLAERTVSVDELGLPATCTRTEVYDDYKEWCKDSNYKARPRNSFFKSLYQARPDLKAPDAEWRQGATGPRGFKGLGLKKYLPEIAA